MKLSKFLVFTLTALPTLASAQLPSLCTSAMLELRPLLIETFSNDYQIMSNWNATQLNRVDQWMKTSSSIDACLNGSNRNARQACPQVIPEYINIANSTEAITAQTQVLLEKNIDQYEAKRSLILAKYRFDDRNCHEDYQAFQSIVDSISKLRVAYHDEVQVITDRNSSGVNSCERGTRAGAQCLIDVITRDMNDRRNSKALPAYQAAIEALHSN